MSELTPYSRSTLKDFAVVALVFTLPFFYKYTTVVLEIIFLLSIIDVVKKKQWPTLHMHWFLPLLFAYFVGSELMTGGKFSGIEKRLSFILLPLGFALNPSFYAKPLQRKIHIGFVLGNLAAVVFCFTRAVVRSVSIQDGHWTFKSSVIPDSTYDFFTSAVMGGNFFFAQDFSYFLHPTYAGILLVLAQFMAFELVRTTESKTRKAGFVIVYFVFLFALFLLSSKATLITSVIISAWILIRMKISRTAKISSIAGFFILCAAVFLFNPRLKVFIETFNVDQLVKPDANARWGHDLRILSWDASREVIKDHWLTGVGEAHKDSAMLKVYTAKGYVVPKEQILNSHNQYLDFWVGGGVLAFAFFIVGLIALFTGAMKEQNYCFVAFLVIFAINALFENILSRHSGILFFSVFVSLWASGRQGMQKPVEEVER